MLNNPAGREPQNDQLNVVPESLSRFWVRSKRYKAMSCTRSSPSGDLWDGHRLSTFATSSVTSEARMQNVRGTHVRPMSDTCPSLDLPRFLAILFETSQRLASPGIPRCHLGKQKLWTSEKFWHLWNFSPEPFLLKQKFQLQRFLRIPAFNIWSLRHCVRPR